MGELEGQVAIVTGSARNIGRSIAEQLAAAGAAVVVNARTSAAQAEAVASGIVARGGRAIAVMADVTQPHAAADLVRAAVEDFGRLDIVVNNAALRMDAPVEDVTFEQWRAVIASILDAAFLCSQAALPHLKRHGSGTIVNIGGVAGHAGVSHRVHVSAAKAGLAGLTRALAAEVAASGVTVNCIAPGRMETARTGPLPAHFLERPVPLGRGGRPDEVAAMVCHLASENGRFMTGQVIHLNGGWYMG
jgi:3-oxoacyl-[acyl-carrier protein] reductase